MITKGDLITGAYSVIRISGLTVNATSEDVLTGLQVLDDYMAELSVELNTGYSQPLEYGTSDPSDDSTITQPMAGPIKKLLAVQLLTHFGKQITPELARISMDGMRSLEHLLVNVGPADNPATLPIGSGNEYDYRSNKFYPEPVSDDDAEEYTLEETTLVTIDWSAWLEGEALSSVEYEVTEGIVVSGEQIADSVSTALISFSKKGRMNMCVKATSSASRVKTQQFRYFVVDCLPSESYY